METELRTESEFPDANERGRETFLRAEKESVVDAVEGFPRRERDFAIDRLIAVWSGGWGRLDNRVGCHMDFICIICKFSLYG